MHQVALIEKYSLDIDTKISITQDIWSYNVVQLQ